MLEAREKEKNSMYLTECTRKPIAVVMVVMGRMGEPALKLMRFLANCLAGPKKIAMSFGATGHWTHRTAVAVRKSQW